MAFYYFEQIKQIENELNIMQNKPKMQLTFGFYCQKMHLKIIKKHDKYEIYHTPTLIFCSPRAKPKSKPIERTPYQSSYVNETGFKESISIQMYTKAQTVMLSSVSSYHA